MNDFNRALQTSKALGDGNRLKIMAALLQHEELCACQITEFLEIAGATASRHLSILSNAGLVECRKEGRWMHYRLSISDDLLRAWLVNSLKGTDLGRLAQIMATNPEDICRKQRGNSCCPAK